MTFDFFAFIFAEGTAAVSEAVKAPGTAVAPQGGGLWQIVMLTFMMLIVMWLLFVLPKRNQAKQMQKMVDGLKKNDKIMTLSGIIGTIYSIDKEQNEIVLTVDSSNNTKIRFSLSAVYFVYKDKEEAAQAEKK